jgi:hypothetical protein
MPSDRLSMFLSSTSSPTVIAARGPLGQFTHGGPTFPGKPGCLALGCGVEDLDDLAFGRNEVVNVKIPG